MPDNDWHKKLEHFLRKKTRPPRNGRDALFLIRQCIEVHVVASPRHVIDDVMSTIRAAFRRYGLVIARRGASAEPERPRQPPAPLGSVTRTVPDPPLAGEDERSLDLRYRHAPPRWVPPSAPAKRPPPVDERR